MGRSKNKGTGEIVMKRILITGADSYIGTSFKNYMQQWDKRCQIDTLDMRDSSWRKRDFFVFFVVYHVAGIAHADVKETTEEQKRLYYKVNTELAVEVAEKSKKGGVDQFIFMSSMIIYSGCKDKIITKNTTPTPLNFYGDSKWQADQLIGAMANDSFKVVILRPPMIYGKGSKGNYPQLAKLAGALPVFPKTTNRRSMLYIDNLCEFVRLMIKYDESGVFFPQNREYTDTSEMVRMIADAKGHGIFIIPGFKWILKLLMKMPGKVGRLADKAFGDFAYEMSMSEYREDYCIVDLERSIKMTEG